MNFMKRAAQAALAGVGALDAGETADTLVAPRPAVAGGGGGDADHAIRMTRMLWAERLKAVRVASTHCHCHCHCAFVSPAGSLPRSDDSVNCPHVGR